MIQEPIILDGDGGAQVFRTKEDAELYTEPIDIKNGEYHAAYDSVGHLLNLEPHPYEYRGVLTETEPPEVRKDELAEVLRTMLSSIAAVRRVPFDAAKLSEYNLEQLIQCSTEYYSR